MSKTITFFSFILLANLGFSQEALRIGEWQSYLPFQNGVTVTQNESQVIYGTPNGLVTIGKKDAEISFISKEDGLSAIDVKNVTYHNSPSSLIVVYQNSNIDLITELDIKNLDNIAKNNVIVGSKEINHVFSDGSKYAYFSSGFGLVQLDMETQKFGFTLITPSAVNASTVFENVLYMATDEGVYFYDLSRTDLISDFGNWDKIGADVGLFETYSSQEISVYKNKLYAGINGDLYKEDDGWFLFHVKDGFSVHYISPGENTLMIGFECNAGCIDRTLFFDENGFQHEAGFKCNDHPQYSIEGDSGKIYYADRNRGFRIADTEFGTCDPQRFNTPYSGNAQDLEVENGVLYVASGNVTESFGTNFETDGFFRLKDGQWDAFNRFSNEQLEESDPRTMWQIKPLPDNSKVYVASFTSGLIEYDFENFTIYNSDNTPIIQPAEGDFGTDRIAGLALDKDMNLWFTNYLANNGRPLVVKKNDGEFLSYDVGCTPSNVLTKIVVDNRGYKWMLNASSSGGVVVYDDIEDRCKSFAANNSELPTNVVFDIELDREGDIWIGTDEGPVIFDGGADIFGGDHAGFQIKIDQDGITAILLVEEEILSLAFDGANRKWLGTRNGIFVQSPNGETEVAYFNASNSPLLDDQINDLAIDQKRGVVWVSTNAGITSIRTEAVAGGAIHVEEEVYVFPNPVRENYDGPIAIKGLAQDANVKITDIQGSLIYETKALGGQAIWDGTNFDGRKAATGVYLVYSSSEPNGFTKADAFVTKILFIK